MTSQINLRTPSKKFLEEIPILIGVSVASKSAVATCPRCTHSISLSRFVWLVPVYTQDRRKACSGFKLIIEKRPGTGTAKWYKNLSKGTMTGTFRYLASTYPENKIFSPSSISELRVTKVVLIRKNLNGQEDGGFWDGRTGDINEGRLGFGDYLYLAWSLA